MLRSYASVSSIAVTSLIWYVCTTVSIHGTFCMTVEDPIVADCLDGDIRLVGGSTNEEGNVQVCLYGAWGSVCQHSFGVNDARVACAQLGFQRAGINNYVIASY